MAEETFRYSPVDDCSLSRYVQIGPMSKRKAVQRLNAKRLATNRESKKRKCAEDHNNSVKTGLRLKEKLPKESVPKKLLKESMPNGLRLIEKV